jgi:SOS-response transcriptional repressor LexA
LRQAAAVNPEDKFELVFRGLLERLFVERMDQNEEIFVRYMNDVPFRDVVSAWMASEAYRRLRDARTDTGTETSSRLPPGLRIVDGRPDERYKTCVPLVPLKAAAGAFSGPQHVEDERFEWVEFNSRHRLRPGMFVAQVVGRSMEPAIPHGSWCLFRAPVEGTRHGKTVLVQLRDSADPETGERYTVKRYESDKAPTGDSWRHERITLTPVNPAFSELSFSGADRADLQVVAEVVEVLGS